jgi:hypothetical protein
MLDGVSAANLLSSSMGTGVVLWFEPCAWPAFHMATASITAGVPDCAASWHRCTASTRSFSRSFPTRCPSAQSLSEICRHTRTAKEVLSECPLRDGIAGTNPLQPVKRSVAPWTAPGLLSDSPKESQWAFVLTRGPSQLKVSPLSEGFVAGKLHVGAKESVRLSS